MAKYVPDIKTERWVIISPARNSRPETAGEPKTGEPDQPRVTCPFCPGNEKATPPEVYRIGEGVKDGPGWQVRVVPNKYPITDIHEVIIHSPNCADDVDTLPEEQVSRVLKTYRDRYRFNQRFGHVMIFCNHGSHAGASLKHPHSQLVVVPRQINLDAVSIEPFTNIVEDTVSHITYCPDFSQWPYEVWIAPKIQGTKFGDVDDTGLAELTLALTTTLKRIRTVLTDPTVGFKQANEPFVFNYYIYHGANWFLRIIPRAIHRAGFELGSGLSVNVVDPTEAAVRLQKAAV